MARPIASIVVLSRNTAPFLKECLSSLGAQKSRIPFEIHVVDQGSCDGSFAQARKIAATGKQKNIFVWKEKKNSLPAACNHGARKARGKILLFIDGDCRAEPGWLESMAGPLLEPSHYPLGALGGPVEQTFGKSARSLWEKYLQHLFSAWETSRHGTQPAFLPWAQGRNFAVRADLFRALKGFDTNLKRAAFDVDFCWRLSLCGFVLGQAQSGRVRRLRRPTLSSLLRRVEDYAYYYQPLLAAYGRELRLPPLRARGRRLWQHSQKLIGSLRSTNSLSQASFRGIDGLVALASLKGAMEACVTGAKTDPRLTSSRRGVTPETVAGQLPRGYAHLHRKGWTYWKYPAEAQASGSLQLYRPRKGERFLLDETAWKIWEVKAEKGQSEDAAEALREDPDDAVVLHRIDEITAGLRTRRLIP
jgi:glycosyltransferase involved in cell wall biosynthesis